MILTDVHDGEVRAVVGSRAFVEHGFNRAVEAQRPVGSLLKPFVYLLALAQPGKWSLASWVDDSPVTIALGHGKRWTPGNSEGRSHGTVRLIDALAQSYNLATVRVGMQVGPERLADLIHTLAGIEATPNPSLILGAVDQSPYAMAQLYQFLASDGEIQPLHAVRGVLDPDGKAVNRYDKAPAPAQEGDAIAARLVTTALQQAVVGGTGRQLVADGLGRLQPAGKTGTSNDSRDSWFAGWTGDHLAVVWVGNDQNQPTGLYGATGAMRVWSGIFSRLPSAPLQVADKGLDWQWVAQSNSTDAACPGARRFAFVAGFARLPLCADADQTLCLPAGAGDERRIGWRNWFGSAIATRSANSRSRSNAAAATAAIGRNDLDASSRHAAPRIAPAPAPPPRRAANASPKRWCSIRAATHDDRTGVQPLRDPMVEDLRGGARPKREHYGRRRGAGQGARSR